MKLRYVTNPGCAIPQLRSKLAQQTLIGGGQQHLIPSDRVRPPTPDHLKSKFAKPKEEKEFGTVSPSAGKRNLDAPARRGGGGSRGSNGNGGTGSRPGTSNSVGGTSSYSGPDAAGYSL